MIILLSPIFNHHPSFGQAVKPFGIETFAPEGAIETLVASILPGFAWRNATGRDALLVEKFGQGLGYQLWAVITSHVLRPPIEHDQLFQDFDDSLM
jgi:hypothetical protein